MKHFIFIFTLLCTFTFGQKLETIKKQTIIGEANHIKISKDGSGNYVLCFDDTKTYLKTSKCVNLGDETYLNNIYTSLKTNFAENEPENIKLDEKKLEFRYLKTSGVKSLYFILYDDKGYGTSLVITEKQLSTIFGKE